MGATTRFYRVLHALAGPEVGSFRPGRVIPAEAFFSAQEIERLVASGALEESDPPDEIETTASAGARRTTAKRRSPRKQ